MVRPLSCDSARVADDPNNMHTNAVGPTLFSGQGIQALGRNRQAILPSALADLGPYASGASWPTGATLVQAGAPLVGQPGIVGEVTSSSSGGSQRTTAPRREARVNHYPAPSSLPTDARTRTRARAPGTRRTLVCDEHIVRMTSLPKITPQHRSYIKRFLCHLEQQGVSWSQLAPDESDVRPAALEETVNKAILDHGLSNSTRGGAQPGVRVRPTGPVSTRLGLLTRASAVSDP